MQRYVYTRAIRWLGVELFNSLREIMCNNFNTPRAEALQSVVAQH